VLAELDDVPLLVFDEVDANVGGEIGRVVGEKMAAIAKNHQVLCVTHLAQVASQADHHVRVAKLTDGKTSRTTLAALGAEERVEELARMLGGVELTQAAREHAREMLGARDRDAVAAAAAKPQTKAQPPVKPLAAPRRGAGSSRGGSARKE
jgi:DNA repair protein RecN (Recombination protein N)